MKSVGLQKENSSLIFFLLLSVSALYVVQSHDIETPKGNTSTVLTASTQYEERQKEAVQLETTISDLKGELVSTDSKPEANREVTLSLAEYTNHPEATYYLLIGGKKLAFQNGIIKYRFPKEGFVTTELRCAFRGKDERLDSEVYEVTHKMQRSSSISASLEND
jgi:hypothetical protein